MRAWRGAAVAVAWVGVAWAAAGLGGSVARGATLELSVRERMSETDIVFRGDRPKENGEIWSSELRAVFRETWGVFELKIEAAAIEDRFNRHAQLDQDTLRGEVQIGMPCWAWTCIAEWKPRYGYDPAWDEPRLRLNYGGLKIRRRFRDEIFKTQVQMLATIAGGFADVWPALFQRGSIEGEFETIWPLGKGLELIVAPKIELASYTNFFDHERSEITSTLRAGPKLNLGAGIAVSLEGQYQVIHSTRANKDGEVWVLTPVLRWTGTL